MSSCCSSCINKCLTGVAITSYVLAATGIIFGLIVSPEPITYDTYQCRVTSVDIQLRGKRLRPVWGIKAMHENGTTDGFLWAATDADAKKAKSARSMAHRYQIDETYPCYRSRNDKSNMSEPWQWDKPTSSHAYNVFFPAGMLFLIGTLCLVLREFIKAKLRNTRQQSEQQVTTPLQTSPSAYDETVQSPVKEQLRS